MDEFDWYFPALKKLGQIVIFLIVEVKTKKELQIKEKTKRIIFNPLFHLVC